MFLQTSKKGQKWSFFGRFLDPLGDPSKTLKNPQKPPKTPLFSVLTGGVPSKAKIGVFGKKCLIWARFKFWGYPPKSRKTALFGPLGGDFGGSQKWPKNDVFYEFWRAHKLHFFTLDVIITLLWYSKQLWFVHWSVMLTKNIHFNVQTMDWLCPASRGRCIFLFLSPGEFDTSHLL